MSKAEQIYAETAEKMEGRLAYIPPFEQFKADMDDYCIDEESEDAEIRDAAEDFLIGYRPMILKQKMLHELYTWTGYIPKADDIRRLENEGAEFVFNVGKKEYIDGYEFEPVLIDELSEDYGGDKEKALDAARKELAEMITETRYGIIIRRF